MTNASTQVFAVVPAAGIGRRMGGSTPKQYLSLSGKTVIEHALQALLGVSAIKQLAVALSADDPHWAALAVARDARVQTVAGGAERAYSVMNALNALPAADDDWVLVHDAVRPCITTAMIERMLADIGNDAVGGVLAVPLADTLKQAMDGRVGQTIDRNGLWCAQTPQVFRYGALKAALAEALQAGVVVTDESAAMERAGFSPRLLMGAASNLKITHAGDLPLAAYWLQSLQESH